MNVYGFAIFLHLLTLGGVFFAAGILALNLARIRSATTLDDLRDASRVLERAGGAMPVLSLLLLLTGGWLVSQRWQWSLSWVAVSVAGLVLMSVVGAALLKPRAKRLMVAARDAGSFEAVPKPAIFDRVMHAGTGANLGMLCGVMFVMAMKPGFAWSILAVLVGALAGAGIAKATER